jgi:hypothetical protein
LIEKSAEIGLSFELATKNKPSMALLPSVVLGNKQFGGFYGINLSAGIFEDEGKIPLFRMLTDIDRLLPIVKEIGSSFYQRTQSDDEIFKPSGVDQEQVKIYIDKALINISSDHQLDKNFQDRLVEYLLEANAELAKPSPSWKRIVGTLVSVSAILGGIAVTPEAIENIQTAYRYIVGSSITSDTTVPKGTIRFIPPPIEI